MRSSRLPPAVWTLAPIFIPLKRHVQIRPEEHALRALFGQDYARYCRRVIQEQHKTQLTDQSLAIHDLSLELLPIFVLMMTQDGSCGREAVLGVGNSGERPE